MAGPGAIPVGAARLLSRQYHCPLVVIFAINASGIDFAVTTYGATKKLCTLAASFGTQFAEAIFQGAVVPPQEEPAEDAAGGPL